MITILAATYMFIIGTIALWYASGPHCPYPRFYRLLGDASFIIIILTMTGSVP